MPRLLAVLALFALAACGDDPAPAQPAAPAEAVTPTEAPIPTADPEPVAAPADDDRVVTGQPDADEIAEPAAPID